MKDRGLQELYARYHELGARLCEELGHDWEVHDPHRYTNVVRLEECTRCGEQRRESPVGDRPPRILEK